MPTVPFLTTKGFDKFVKAHDIVLVKVFLFPRPRIL